MNSNIPIKIRPWTMADLPSLVKYGNNLNVSKYLMDRFPHPYTEADGKSFIEFATKDDPVHVFAIDMNGEAIGGVGVFPQEDVFRKNAEIGYWLAEPYWGKGIITVAIKQIVDFAFNTYDIERIFARPYGNNPASQRALEKNGFVLEARFEKTVFKNEEFLDELIFAIRKANRI